MELALDAVELMAWPPCIEMSAAMIAGLDLILSSEIAPRALQANDFIEPFSFIDGPPEQFGHSNLVVTKP
jgi:hypothetical protein